MQAFTAAGQVLDDAPFQVSQDGLFQPFRRKMHYLNVGEASIHPLLKDLSFTKDRSNWGMAVRRGVFKISRGDYDRIVHAMKEE